MGGGGGELRFRALYNLGNAYFNEREYSRAAETYQEALRLVSNDVPAKHNLEVTLEMLRQQAVSGGSPDDDTPNPTPRPGDGAKEPQPQNDAGMSQDEAKRLLDMLGEDDSAKQQQRLKNMLPPQYNVEKDW